MANLTSADTAIEDLKSTASKEMSVDRESVVPPKDNRPEAAAKGSRLQPSIESTSDIQAITKVEHFQKYPSNEQGDLEEAELSYHQGIQGGYNYTLVDKTLHSVVEFKCQICQFIPREPAKVSCCGLIFCCSCITSHCEENSACPSCSETFDWIIDKLLERKIHSLKVYCVNRDRGCAWSGDLSHMKEHTRSAKLTDEGADDTGIEQCQYELTTCKKCDEEMMYVELDDHMTDYCQHRVTRCDFEFAGCNSECAKSSLKKHLEDNTSKHLSLLSEFVLHRQAKSKHHLKFSLLAVFIFVLALGCITIYNFLVMHTAEQISSSCNKIVADKLENLASMESLGDVEWTLGEVKRLTVANELAIENLQYSIKDLSQRIQDLEDTVNKLKVDGIVRESDVQSTLDQLKLDVADLKSGFTKQIDDSVKAAVRYFFPEKIDHTTRH